MKGKILYIILMIGCLCSCSTDDDAPGTIEFSASTTDAPTPQNAKSAVINGTTMVVSAFTGTDESNMSTLMDQVAVTRINGVWKYSPEVMWPSTPVDFYAYTPVRGAAATLTPQLQMISFDCPGTEDMQCAMLRGATQAEGKANMTFSHALARVEVNVRCSDPSVHINVGDVTMHGIIEHSTFYYPYKKGAEGSWSPYTASAEELAENMYTICNAEPQPQPVSTEYTNYNTTMCYFFIPQELNAYDGTKGGYLNIGLQVCNADTYSVTWPVGGNASTYGRVSMPLCTEGTAEWLPGMKYDYNITVGVNVSGAAVIESIDVVVTPY